MYKDTTDPERRHLLNWYLPEYGLEDYNPCWDDHGMSCRQLPEDEVRMEILYESVGKTYTYYITHKYYMYQLISTYVSVKELREKDLRTIRYFDLKTNEEIPNDLEIIKQRERDEYEAEYPWAKELRLKQEEKMRNAKLVPKKTISIEQYNKYNSFTSGGEMKFAIIVAIISTFIFNGGWMVWIPIAAYIWHGIKMECLIEAGGVTII